MIKVLYMDQTPKLGGAELCLYDILSNLDRKIYRPMLLTFAEGELTEQLRSKDIYAKVIPLPPWIYRLKREAFHMFYIPVYLLLLLPSLSNMIYFISKEKFDIIHTNSMKCHLLGAFLGLFTRTPVVWHIRDIVIHKYLRFILRFIGKRSVKKIIVVSDALKPMFSGCDNLIRLYDGIDYGQYSLRQSRKEIKAQLHIPEHKIVVSQIGRFDPLKGQNYVLHAITHLKNRERYFFLFAGDALFGENNYKKELLEIVDKYHLQKQTLFTGFFKDISRIYAISDIILHPSILPDSLPRVIIESLLFGKPVITTDLGGAKEILGNKGIFIRPKSSSDIIKALEDTVRNKKFHTITRKKDLQKFDIHSHLKNLYKVYQICI